MVSRLRKNRAERDRKDTAQKLQAALKRLRERVALDAKGKGEGRRTKVTPASVCREAGVSRNALYENHRDILEQIKASVSPADNSNESTQAKIKRLQNRIVELEAQVRDLTSRNALKFHQYISGFVGEEVVRRA